MDLNQKYKQLLARFLSSESENIFLYWKGRVALYALLKAMGVKKGDEVLLSGLTCVVVPNAIKYLGAKPVYVDIDTETYNPSVVQYKEKTTNFTKVIIVQNTFGLSSDVEEIVRFAKKNSIFTIEDCTHGFGGYYNGKPNGTYCDAAFFSTQWNKPFSTGIGGFCLVNNTDLKAGLVDVNKNLVLPGKTEQMLLSVQFFANRHFLNKSNYWSLRSLYRKLSKWGIVIGSSDGGELKDTKIPENYFKSMSDVQIKLGIKGLDNLMSDLHQRRSNAEVYSEFLKLNNKQYVSEKLWKNHSFLVYPILVKDRDDFLLKAEKKRIKLGDWFVSPIHPVKENYDIWDLNDEIIPKAVYISKHLLNLPTLENSVTDVEDFLKMNLADIL